MPLSDSRRGVRAIDDCGDGIGQRVDISHAEVNDLRRYGSPANTGDGYATVVDARNGGIVILLLVNVLSTTRCDDAVEHLITVALDKLASLGRVEVSG